MWDFESLCDGSYVWHNGLNGSTIWSKDYTGKSPFTIPIYVKEKPYLENVMYVKFSRDCAWAAVAFQMKDNSGELMLYKMFDSNIMQLTPGKQMKKEKRTIKIPQCKTMGPIIDIFIFKELGSDQYSMYLILQHGILFYPAIEKNKDGVTKLDDQTLKLTSQCADFNYDTNTLVVDICKREGTKEEHFIRIYHK